MSHTKRSLAALTVVSLILVSCQPDCDPPAKADAPPAGVSVQLLPLFRGDMQRIEPHLGLSSSACLNVDPHGKKIPLFLHFLVWHNGKVVRNQYMNPTQVEEATEITFSLKEELVLPGQKILGEAYDGKGQVYRAVVALPGQSSSSFFVRPVLKENAAGVGPMYQKKPKAADLKEGQDFDFWGLFAGDGDIGRTSGEETLEEKAKRVEWAIVLRLSLQDYETVRRKNK